MIARHYLLLLSLFQARLRVSNIFWQICETVPHDSILVCGDFWLLRMGAHTSALLRRGCVCRPGCMRLLMLHHSYFAGHFCPSGGTLWRCG